MSPGALYSKEPGGILTLEATLCEGRVEVCQCRAPTKTLRPCKGREKWDRERRRCHRNKGMTFTAIRGIFKALRSQGKSRG